MYTEKMTTGETYVEFETLDGDTVMAYCTEATEGDASIPYGTVTGTEISDLYIYDEDGQDVTQERMRTLRRWINSQILQRYSEGG
jgi:hypothetical protein